jgi:hypothetical protein
MIKTMKEIITAPTTNIRIPRNIMNWEKTIEKTVVSLSVTIKEMPRPMFSQKRRRKRVDATHNVKLIMIRLV